MLVQRFSIPKLIEDRIIDNEEFRNYGGVSSKNAEKAATIQEMMMIIPVNVKIFLMFCLMGNFLMSKSVYSSWNS